MRVKVKGRATEPTHCKKREPLSGRRRPIGRTDRQLGELLEDLREHKKDDQRRRAGRQMDRGRDERERDA